MIVDMWICDFVWSDDLKLSLKRPESLTRVKLKETSHTKLEPLVHLMAIMAQFASIYLSFMLIIHSIQRASGHNPLYPGVLTTNEAKFSGWYGIPAAKHRNDF